VVNRHELLASLTVYGRFTPELPSSTLLETMNRTGCKKPDGVTAGKYTLMPSFMRCHWQLSNQINSNLAVGANDE